MSLLTAVQNLVESLNRLGLHGAVGKKREKAARTDVADYFRLMASKMPVDKLAALIGNEHKDAAKHNAEITIRRVLRGVQPVLVSALASNKLLAWKEGYKLTVVQPLIEAADEFDPVLQKQLHIREGDDPPGDITARAADFAATSAAEAVAGIDATTQDALQTIIADAIDNQSSVDELARQLADELVNMSRDRAKVIARTEMSDAFAQAALDKLNDYGIAYKQWISYTDCCDECSENDDDGAIPVEELFSSGDDAPPAHPNCRCTIAGARAPEEA